MREVDRFTIWIKNEIGPRFIRFEQFLFKKSWKVELLVQKFKQNVEKIEKMIEKSVEFLSKISQVKSERIDF